MDVGKSPSQLWPHGIAVVRRGWGWGGPVPARRCRGTASCRGATQRRHARCTSRIAAACQDSSACCQPWVLPATGVGLGMGRNRPRSAAKGWAKPWPSPRPPPEPPPEPGPEPHLEPGPGPHPGPGWTAQRPCYHGREEGVHLHVQRAAATR